MKKYIIIIAAFLLILAIWNNDLQSKRQIEKDKINLQTREFEQKVRFQQEESEREEREKADKERREAITKLQLGACLAGAYDDYSLNWDSACESRSLGKDCSLANAVSKRLEDIMQTAKDNCYKQYK